MRRILSFVLCLIAATPALAQTQEPVPERRSVITRDVDFFGGDLQPLFDTTLEACERVCLNDTSCAAFTFNSRAGSCFPKTGISARQPYDGALSGLVLPAEPGVPERAAARADDLDMLRAEDLSQARAEAAALGRRHPGGDWAPQELLRAAAEARERGDTAEARDWTGAALAQTDAADLWLDYGRLNGALAEQHSRDAQLLRERAVSAAINGYLRAPQEAGRIAALIDLARALEAADRGRDMVPVLRLAESIAPREEVTRLLDDAIGKYGFRITDTRGESDSAAPRICVEFSEPLVRAGQDYAPFVGRPDARLTVEPGERELCVGGVAHGSRYALTFREGLPAESGETLNRSVEITQYVRDRSPAVRFPGRAYVLPPTPDTALPVETVNADTLELTLLQVSDRNVLRTIQEDMFARPLSQYELTSGAGEIAEEVWTGTASVDSELNADMRTRLPVGDALRGPGLYALVAALPGADPYDDSGATQWFLVSDLGLTTLSGSDGLTAIVRGLSDAQPREGVSLTLLSRSNRPLGTAATDARGVATFAPGLLRGTGGAAPALILAEAGEDDSTFLSLVDPAFDLSDRGVAGRAPAGPVDVFLATDRGAYRAGEAIHATALMRDAKAAALPGVPATAILTRPDGVEHARSVSAESEAGGHVFDFPLSPAVPRGTWRLAIHADPEAPALADTTLLVEDFVPERIDVTLDLPEGPIRPLAPPELGIEARYLFGAPGGDLPVEGELRLAPVTTLEALPGWRFGRHDELPDPRTEALPADLRTDAEGRAALPLPLPDTELSVPHEATAIVRVAEGSGRPVERRVTRPVLPAGPMIGLRPGFDDTLPEGEAARFDLQAFGPDLAPQPMQVRWTLNRVTTRYQWYALYGNWSWEPVTTREQIATGEAALGEAPFSIEEPVEWGEYELVVERLGGPYTATSMAFSSGWYAPADAGRTPDFLELSLDAERYAPGDTATLRMVPRSAGQALVTVLTDRVVSMQAVEVAEGESTLTLDVTEEWGAGAYVTAEVLRPMDAEAGRMPARALGLAHAAVAPGDKRLSVSIDAPEEVRPRGPLRATVRVDGLPDGQAGFVTLAAVDQGVLNLTGFEPPDPARYYFGQRRLGVEIRDLYGRLIDGMSGSLGQVRSGGDAGAQMRMQSPPPTEEVVAFFEGPIAVDDSGAAKVSFDLPDFNGTVKLMAVAWTSRAVGSAARDVLVRDPVVVTASLPRFLAPGDTAELALELTHAAGPAGRVGLDITADGLGLDPGAVPSGLSVAEGATERLRVPISAREVGDHEIRIAITTPEGEALTKTLTLGVRRNDPVVSETRRLVLEPGQTFTLDDQILAGLAPESAEALVSAGTLARFDVPGMLASLGRYPYGCTEQVTSQALPLLSLSSVSDALGLGGEAAIDRQIGQAVDRVLARQAPNGAFGMWSAGSGEGWLDAYVTDFLSRARAAGHDVPDRAFGSALDNLANRIDYAPDFDEGGEDVAYALLILAREGRAAMGDLRYYADVKADAFGTPMALAQLGAALAQYGDQTRADRLFRAAAARLSAPEGPRVYRADFGSPQRDAAGLLSLAVEAGSDALDRGSLLTRIASADRPMSTQDQAWSLLAAQALVGDAGAPGLSVDGAVSEGPYVRRLSGRVSTQELRNAGTGPFPLTVTTLGVPDVAPGPGGYGYALERQYFTLEGAPVSVADGPLPQGTRLVAVLTVRPADPTPARLILDDPLPAGFEIDNPALLQGGDIAGLDWLETAEAEHAEFRTDRFVAAVDWQGTDPFRLAYLVRAVSPGGFHHPAASVEDMYRPEYRARTGTGRVSVSR
ncbi:alpha-2-macroglobulin family protein [Roseivivax sediminis]|uniref:Apple domain-containing protein n=1 Tax=Roseivivax sediminis TaxID=936889 RepID=A0A1I1U481_9RHOB|nr:alpha-2-macroglobulin family protein [Roseivivax sediminis]SFD65661.1 hypothetical protein SAMN04515678_102147 [Roseivivax sediminis]